MYPRKRASKVARINLTLVAKLVAIPPTNYSSFALDLLDKVTLSKFHTLHIRLSLVDYVRYCWCCLYKNLWNVFFFFQSLIQSPCLLRWLLGITTWIRPSTHFTPSKSKIKITDILSFHLLGFHVYPTYPQSSKLRASMISGYSCCLKPTHYWVPWICN